ncbi:MAG: SDR family oxidoreductase, partial [Verrucomicrobia bacterium]|nr:SDR family oxidoreductase [Verrucomicrobiota bacterium]
PNDVAFAVIYFLSDASSWVTGSDLKIDGGYTLI